RPHFWRSAGECHAAGSAARKAARLFSALVGARCFHAGIQPIIHLEFAAYNRRGIMKSYRIAITFSAIMLTGTSVAYAAFDSADAPKGGALEIIRITPGGDDVSAGKQIVIQFNRPVVPVGRMERSAAEIPVIATPALNCEWRWINNSALA